MSDSELRGAFFSGLCIGLFVGGLAVGMLLACVSASLADKNRILMKEAVGRNVAEWVVDDDGKSTWRWKE